MLQNQIDQLSRELAPHDLVEFNRYVFGMETPPHMKFVAEDGLMDFTKKKIFIILPFKHVKSPIVSVVYPSWILGRDPLHHFLIASNSGDNAMTFSKSVREVIALNTKYQEVFPNTQVDPRRGWSGNSWFVKRPVESDANPTFRSVGFTGTVMGRGADCLIFDDINDQDNSQSDYLCDKVNSWWQSGVRSRRLHEDSREIGVATRWAKMDVPAEAMKLENGFWIYWAPALSEGKEVYINRRDPEGNWEKFLIHNDGPALWPERWSQTYLLNQREVLGAGKFSLMYQGQLIEGEEGWITEKNFKYIDDEDNYIIRVQAWDTGLGGKRKTRRSSYTAMIEIGVTADGNIDILDIVRKRMNAPEINSSIVQQWEFSHPNKVGIEEAAAGVSSIEILRREHTEVPIVAIPTKNMSKIARASILEVYYQNGQVRHLRGIPHLRDYEAELLGFTNVDSSDMVDACAHAFHLIAGKARPRKRKFLAITGDGNSDSFDALDSEGKKLVIARKPALALW